MFILETLEDQTYLMRAEPGWDLSELDEFFDVVKGVLQRCISSGVRCVLVYKVRSDFDTPIHIYLRIVAFLLSIQDLISGGLERTVIWLDSEGVRTFLDMLLTLYQPTRPLTVHTDVTDVCEDLSHLSEESLQILAEVGTPVPALMVR